MKNFIDKWKTKIELFFYSPYCRKCGSCGEDGCCSALKCAYKKMKGNKYCKGYYQDLEFAHKMFAELYTDTPEQKKIWEKIHEEVYR